MKGNLSAELEHCCSDSGAEARKRSYNQGERISIFSTMEERDLTVGKKSLGGRL